MLLCLMSRTGQSVCQGWFNGKVMALQTSLRSAARFVDRVGVALVFPDIKSPLPTLWEEVVGTPEVKVFTTSANGKKVLTPEMEHVWQLKNQLGQESLACVGKYERGRLTLVSLRKLPEVYAQCGRSGHPEDFRDVEALSPLERRLAEALLEDGLLTAPELRMVIGGSDVGRTKRALESLQRRLVVTQAGEAKQDQGWDAVVFDLLARRYSSCLSGGPRR
jgi:hypothetical protein